MNKRIPFDLDLWLKNPRCKVFTRSGQLVTDLTHFSDSQAYASLAGVTRAPQGLAVYLWHKTGTINYNAQHELDLFLEIPLKLKEFNLQEWLDTGKPNCYTRVGLRVDPLYYHEKLFNQPKLFGLVHIDDFVELIRWNWQGLANTKFEGKSHNFDLMLVDEEE